LIYAVFTGILPCSRPVLEVSTLPAAPASRAAGREVTPVELFRLLPAHFAAVLVCTLLGGILAFAAARLAPRSYQAEAQLYVAAAQEGLTSGYAELQLTADYQELLTSRTMLESVISTLGLSTDTAHLKDQITILHPADTHILRIVAADSSPQWHPGCRPAAKSQGNGSDRPPYKCGHPAGNAGRGKQSRAKSRYQRQTLRGTQPPARKSAAAGLPFAVLAAACRAWPALPAG